MMAMELIFQMATLSFLALELTNWWLTFIPFCFPFCALLAVTRWLEYFLCKVLKQKQRHGRSLEGTLLPYRLTTRCQDQQKWRSNEQPAASSSHQFSAMAFRTNPPHNRFLWTNIFWNIVMPINLHIAYSCFFTTWHGCIVMTGQYKLQNLKPLCSGLLQKKIADFCFRPGVLKVQFTSTPLEGLLKQGMLGSNPRVSNSVGLG